MSMQGKGFLALACLVVVVAAPSTVRADQVSACLTGYGQGGEPLSACLQIDISPDGKLTNWSLKNTSSVTSGSSASYGIGESPYIVGLAFNLNNFDSQASGIIMSNSVVNPSGIAVDWQLQDSAGMPPGGWDHSVVGVGDFQYLVYTLDLTDTLGVDNTLNFDLFADCGNFATCEVAFTSAEFTSTLLGDVQVAAIFLGVDSQWGYGVATGTFRCDGCNEPVPEPATMVLLGAGVVGLGVRRLRRRRRAA